MRYVRVEAHLDRPTINHMFARSALKKSCSHNLYRISINLISPQKHDSYYYIDSKILAFTDRDIQLTLRTWLLFGLNSSHGFFTCRYALFKVKYSYIQYFKRVHYAASWIFETQEISWSWKSSIAISIESRNTLKLG